MTEVKILERMDPALKKLLDDLPEGDPDEMAVVWTDYTPERQLIPVNQRCYLKMGQWLGPPTRSGAVLLHAEYHGERGYALIELTDNTIYPGDILEIEVRVNT